MHDATRAAGLGALAAAAAGGGGGFEGAVCLSAACVDSDFRRRAYSLPVAVPPEERLVRGDSRKSK